VWKRFLFAGVLIIAVSAGATYTLALRRIGRIAEEAFPKGSLVNAPRSLVTPEYSGGPETFLVLGTDRREGSLDLVDRTNPPHSDTMLLVRFDPEQGQTSILSIPRDLMVNIDTRSGAIYAPEKINSAYTIGSREAGARGGMVLAAETIKREVFPTLRLNGIVDVNFKGFIQIVDALGCAYVNVDHRYFNQNVGTPETDYTSIDLQPGYQKLCYRDALDYVRYRHTDSDFVRVARQQDFLRALREQVSPEDVEGQIDKVAKAVGNAISSTIHGSAGELIKLAKLIAFSQAKPVRQVKFLAANESYYVGSTSFVTSTPELERQTLEQFLSSEAQPGVPAQAPVHVSRGARRTVRAGSVAGLTATSASAQAEAAKAAPQVPFRVLYPALQTVQSQQLQVRPYDVRDPSGQLHRAYAVVWEQSRAGGYYDLEATDWSNPPLFSHARVRVAYGRRFLVVDDGSHIHVVGWRSRGVLYWLTNTLLEELSNAQMLAIADSARALR
jgi:LCP family protein required for cell wall assembly